ncbi:MAG TPA: hypothetical protein VIU45_04890 [Chitinophagaceae bacterium]
MKPVTRDLLILLSQSKYSETEIEREASFLNDILPKIETLDTHAKVIEVIEINRHRISSKPQIIARAFRQNMLKSFQFILHKN